MRILMHGAGVLGGNLALNFYKVGKDVSLVARGEWAKTIREKGACHGYECAQRSSLMHKAMKRRIGWLNDIFSH